MSFAPLLPTDDRSVLRHFSTSFEILMNCPTCEAPLEARTRYNVRVDTCAKCRGMWFDTATLRRYLGRLLTERKDIPHDTPELHKQAAAVKNLKEETRACPRCEIAMGKINYAYDSNVFLDRCPECEGLWVDDGEILKLAIFTKGNPLTDKIAHGIASLSTKREQRRNLVEAMKGLNQRVSPLRGVVPLIILPLGDERTRSIVPFFTFGLIAANLLLFAAEVWWINDIETFIRTFGLIPVDVLAGTNLQTLGSHMFLHAGIIHVLGNMWFLWVFGDNIEEDLGHIAFLAFYFASGIAAALIHVAANVESSTPCIGASGAISGILGAYFFLHRNNSVSLLVFFRVIQVPAWIFIGAWFVVQIAYAVLAQATDVETGVAWYAHIGGFVAGGSIALVFGAFKGDKLRDR